MSSKGFLVLQSGAAFEGIYLGGEPQAGEVVFNTSHSGYEEMATDPSYFSQILVTTASQQGNYGVDNQAWESHKMWIQGFVCLQMQNSQRDSAWLDQLKKNKVPVLTEVDTRALVMYLRSQGCMWGAVVNESTVESARTKAYALIEATRKLPSDWTQLVCRKKIEIVAGHNPRGPRVAVLDFGTKENILRELKLRTSELAIFPSNSTAAEIKAWNPDGIVLSNGPGDPAKVQAGIETVRGLLGYRFIFGICMGHQVLGLALGAETYKLRFGHRGSNHPIRDEILGKIYVTSQNHGYNIAPESLPDSVRATHYNLNDNTVAGIMSAEDKCLSVQFHPESHPGPHDSVELFDYFIKQIS